jgi:hypothetical protein
MCGTLSPTGASLWLGTLSSPAPTQHICQQTANADFHSTGNKKKKKKKKEKKNPYYSLTLKHL